MRENIIELQSLDQPGVEIFTSMTEAQLRRRMENECGIFIAESPKVINVALAAGYEPVALLAEKKHLDGDAAQIAAQMNGRPIYTGSRELLKELTGYTLTRGVLCAMRRKPLPSLSDLARHCHRIAVIDSVCDTTNIGAIFRSAAALGIDAVALTPTSCDPLNRRSIRVSMGSVFLVPWTWIDHPDDSLHEVGFTTVAMALRNDSVTIDSPILKATERLAIILGTEGDGLSQQVIDGADYVARIPMAHNVDSLNVAAASAVAFWELGKEKR